MRIKHDVRALRSQKYWKEKIPKNNKNSRDGIGQNLHQNDK